MSAPSGDQAGNRSGSGACVNSWVTDLRVVVIYVSVGELVNLHAEYGAHIDRRDIRQDSRHGFRS